jgi:hypothetical protein
VGGKGEKGIFRLPQLIWKQTKFTFWPAFTLQLLLRYWLLEQLAFNGFVFLEE